MDLETSKEKEAIRYFLGELDEMAQARLEERFFYDAELSEWLTDVEDDLIDQYVRDELSAGERRRFEQHFLISERRRDKVQLARALLQAEKATVAAPGKSRFADRGARRLFLYSPRPSLTYLFAAATVLLLVVGAWLFFEVRELRREIARMEAERQSRAQQEEQLRGQMAERERQSQELATQNERLEKELALLKPDAERANTQAPDALPLLTFTLSPSSRSGDSPKTLTLPASAQAVRLQLNLSAGDDYATYQVRLQTASGAPVRSWYKLPGRATRGGRFISVTVPVGLLHAGQYELQLSGVAAPGRIDDLGYYYFNLVKD